MTILYDFYILPKFLFRNINILILSGEREALLLLTIWPARLKMRSLGTLEADIHKYFLAIDATFGYRILRSFHQISGLYFETGSATYLPFSFLAISWFIYRGMSFSLFLFPLSTVFNFLLSISSSFKSPESRDSRPLELP